tara:strand:+ start:5342 stop:5779 length:438 start_codon:yes stop_codon:yes gene_type:complete
MLIEIRKEPFNGYKEIEHYENNLGITGKFGATASFIGSMRDFNDGREIEKMFLEYYPKMTEKALSEISTTAKKKWDLIEILLLHRVGNISIGDHIVLVSVWSAHRKEAFEGCRFIMEELKSNAPFWKKEKSSIGENWVEKNTPGI